LCKPFFDEHTIYGAALAFVIPFVAVAAGNTQLLGIDKKYRIWIFALLILLVAGEYFAYSRAGVLSLMASLILYVFLKLNVQFKHLLIGLAMYFIADICLSIRNLFLYEICFLSK
jgi:putative inorganic carbon (HCO3(-)) transporter